MLKVLAAQTLKIASINGLGELDKLENELEDEIRYENRSPAKTTCGRLRQKCEHKLHSKIILLLVVLLNIIDCILVLAELTLDFHHVSQLLEAKEKLLDSFSENLYDKYEPTLDPWRGMETSKLLQQLLEANIIFNMSSVPDNLTHIAFECVQLLNQTAAGAGQSLENYITTSNLLIYNWSGPSACFEPYSASSGFNGKEGMKSYTLSGSGQADEKLIVVAHKLHYASIAILSVLVIFCFLKLICSGTRFFKSRMQVFDSIIVVISFVLDLVFIEGITAFQMEESAIIITVLMPWRIIRIVNSLIVAVLDKQRLNLKIIYTQKKKISRTLTETNTKLEVMQRHIEVLQSLCSSRGIGDHDVRKVLGRENSGGGSQKNGSSGGLSMALGKLAFQAADAFAPITGGSKKINKVNGSAPALTSGDNSENSSLVKGNIPNENNNAISFNQNEPPGFGGQEEPEKSQSPPQELATSASDDNLESVSIHVLNSETTAGRNGEKDRKQITSISLPDLTEDGHVVSDCDVVSRL